ncbi:MAG: hypothetical protein GY751_22715 [Bacteroidetes bacterium]|nr:hypothetical protein [Bacteroidota bacterium]
MNTSVKSKVKVKPYEDRVQRQFRTYMLMMFFAIGSISLLFLALTATYFFSKGLVVDQLHLPIPPIFYVDTVLLGLGSFALYMAQLAFKKDKVTSYKVWLYAALMTGVVFTIGQVLGWYTLSLMGFGASAHRSGAFMLFISAIHVAHILGGVVFMTYLFLKASKKLKDVALAVVYFSDPVPRSQLKLMNYYWHFLCVLWLYLLVFFVIVG